MKVDFNKLKNDEEYRNNYLREKEVAYNNFIREKKRKQIENEYIDEFNDYTFQKERSMYESTIRNIKNNYQNHIRIENMKGPYEITFPFPASNEWYKEKNVFKYSGNQKRVLNYIVNLTGQNINDNITMGKNEYKEFQKFILERDPDYEDYL